MNKNILVLLVSLFFLSACGSDNVKDEEYQFAGGLKLLDIPPDLTNPNKNLVMEIPRASLRACEILIEADREFKLDKARKEALQAGLEKAAKEQQKTEE